MRRSRKLFFYCYERDSRYRENLIFFLSVAYRSDLDFFLIISGACSVIIPEWSNLRLFYVENKNHDYGGYSSVVRQLKEQLYGYEYYIFVNSSVRGPFLRFAGMNWVYCFLRFISSDIGLVGSGINILPEKSKYSEMMRSNYDYFAPYSHVQTTVYVLSE